MDDESAAAGLAIRDKLEARRVDYGVEWTPSQCLFTVRRSGRRDP